MEERALSYFRESLVFCFENNVNIPRLTWSCLLSFLVSSWSEGKTEKSSV